MDPLTHTLVGANLASTRLGDTTRLATAALVIGANLPDVDAILYFTGHRDLALGFRRGWTHGALAIVVLPFILTGLMMLYDRLRPDPARPVRARWLLMLSALAVLTHPTLDWLNNYGMRWLMPFRGTWYYGDSVFIMDPWLWLALGAGWLAGRRPTPALIAAFAVVALLLAYFVGRRAPSYLVVVIIVAIVLFGALVWRGRRGFATVALAIAFAYIGARIAINAVTAREVRDEVARRGATSVERLMVSPHPIDPRRWEVVAQTGDVYRYGGYMWGGGGLSLADEHLPVPRDTPEWRAARRDPSIRGFMTWVRFPWYEVERRPDATLVRVHDARYARREGRGLGSAVVVIPHAPR